MAAAAPLTNFLYAAAPDNPGWLYGRLADPSRSSLGKQIDRAEGAETVRMCHIPHTPLHANSTGKVHGAITLGRIGVSLFAAPYLLRVIDAGRAVSLGLSTQFIGKGDDIAALFDVNARKDSPLP